ncbi:MAG: hypothetical protein AB8B92_07985 [Gammaproteobacteria bacterium]
MKLNLILSIVIFCISLHSFAADNEQEKPTQSEVDIEKIWMDYAKSKGGITWGMSKEYPEYENVNEGDTILIQLQQGPCLMEFFHNRWRRANDVRRWDESVNEYGGCPYVFE